MAEKPQNDVIAAIATAPGCGGIGVVRVSGPDLEGFGRALTGKTLSARRATLADFRDAGGVAIDQGIVLWFQAPYSFTGEDVLELQGHGGPVVLARVLQRCLELGARVAQPGEFTRRAFLNDKLDLAQAESVADLIEASTDAAARAAMRSLSGDFSRTIQNLVGRLIELRALVEATLDFPDEEVDFLQEADALGRLQQLSVDIERVRLSARRGSLLRTGLTIVLVGRPNVGKSSLLNRLAGHERAIVTDVPGTTRDTLRETIQIHGIPLNVVDTAGLRETSDPVERLGIERTWAEVHHADVIVVLRDWGQRAGWAHDDIEAQMPLSVPRVVVWNKIDTVFQEAFSAQGPLGTEIGLSAKTGQGTELLATELLQIAGWSETGSEDVVLARHRHIDALNRAAAHISQASQAGWQLELFAEELRLCQQALSEITGEFTPDDLLGQVFSRFCIGK